jgi:hypothetical protein
MDNLDFLKQILIEEHEYYIVAEKNESYSGRRSEFFKDSIMLICIPYGIKRGVKPKEILLCDIENLRYIELQNIYINERYAPFQQGINLCNIYKGFPIKGDVQDFLIKALALKSDSIFDYRELAESIE